MATLYNSDNMGQKYCKNLHIEVDHDLHAKVTREATARNLTIREFILRCIKSDFYLGKLSTLEEKEGEK